MIIIQDEGDSFFAGPPVQLGITPVAFAEFLSSKQNQVCAIDGWAIGAEVSHIAAEATGNVITVKLYLKS